MSLTYRNLFPIPENVAYFNCASLAPTMNSACEAGIQGLWQRARPWTMPMPASHHAEADRARALFARLINARPEDIALTPATSYGIAVASRNLPLAPGRRIVMPARQHYSNVFEWRVRARKTGETVHEVDKPAEGAWTEPMLAAMDETTGIVTVPNCDWLDGRLFDLERIARRCREVGARLVVDATQSLGVLPLDVSVVRPDFVACSSFKWLLGPSNLSLLYVAPEFHEGEPLEHHAFNRVDYMSDSRRLAGGSVREDFEPGAARFDMGQRNQHVLLPMLNNALEALEAWTPPTIRDGIDALSRELQSALEGIGVVTRHRSHSASHIIGIRFPDEILMSLGRELSSRAVHATVRDGYLRLSPHLYNTRNDIERLVAALDEILPTNDRRTIAS